MGLWLGGGGGGAGGDEDDKREPGLRTVVVGAAVGRLTASPPPPTHTHHQRPITTHKQIPLISLTAYLRAKVQNDMLGNAIFWTSFCVLGQPLCILLYAHGGWCVCSACACVRVRVCVCVCVCVFGGGGGCERIDCIECGA